MLTLAGYFKSSRLLRSGTGGRTIGRMLLNAEKKVAFASRIAADRSMTTHRLSADLEELLRRHGGSGFSLREVLSTFAERGYGLLLVLLALPSAMPVPAPGYSTPFGVALFLIGAQILAGKTIPWLPGWVLDRRVPAETGRKMIAFGIRCFGRLERWIRPRHAWSFRKGGHWFSGGAVVVMATLMILPIPLTNTAPAGVVFLIGVGLLEKDGMVLGAALGLSCLAILLYLAAFYLIFHFGLQGWEELKEVIRGWLGS